jgi:hypothetical protein
MAVRWTPHAAWFFERDRPSTRAPGEMIFAAAFARTKRVSRFPRHAFLPTNIMPKIYNDTIHSWLTPAYQNRDI